MPGVPQKRRSVVTCEFQSLEQRALLAGGGLSGIYFQDTGFETPLGTRIDPAINFAWQGTPVLPGSVRPAAASGHGFSARWTGQIQPKFSEYYTFYTQSNGGVRLWINGKLLIDDGANQAPVEQSTTLHVKLSAAQTYNMQLDYVNSHPHSTLKLLWRSTRTAKQVLPTARLWPVATTQRKTRISFRDPSAPAPQYYRLDKGAVFGSRGGKYQYGWDQDNSTNAFHRDSALSYSPRYDGGALMDPNGQDRTWRIAVANGLYNVRVVAGDPSNLDSYYAIDVNGIAAVRGSPNAYTRWLDGTVTVNVTDGFIRLSNGAAARNNKIDFVEITPTTDDRRLVSWQTIGFSANPDVPSTTRWVNPALFTGGWQGYVDTYIKPEIALGYKRFVLHNPFGIGDGKQMHLDEYLEAKDQGLTWLTDGFVQAFKPIIASGVEIIAYVGNAGEPAFTNLLNGSDDTAWMNRFWACLQPMLDAGMSIGFDDSVDANVGSPLYNGLQLLRARDVTVYVESRPMVTQPWTVNFPSIIMEGFWESTEPGLSPNNVWAYSKSELTHEVIRWLNMPSPGFTWHSPGWVAREAVQILSQGNTASIDGGLLGLDGIDVKGLIARGNGYKPAMIQSASDSK